jgi:hypothetical protein
MKGIIFLGLFVIIFSGCVTTIPEGYPLDAKTGSLIYEEVVTIANYNAADLYKFLKQWVSEAYVSANTVIQLDDKENHILIIKGLFTTNLFGKLGSYDHMLKIETKDGRFRYILTIYGYYSKGSGQMNFTSSSMGFKGLIYADADSQAKSFIEGMKSKLSSPKDSNW